MGNQIDVAHSLSSVTLKKERDDDEFNNEYIELEAFKSWHLKNNFSPELCQKYKDIHKF